MTIISQEIEHLLTLTQKESDLSKEQILTNALQNYLEDMQDYKSALEAEKRLLKNPRLSSLDELMKKANINASEL